MPIRDRLPDTMTPRERAEMDWEREVTRIQEELTRRQQEFDLEIKKLEVKWTQLFRLPEAILLLPVRFVMSLAIPISVITKKELPDKFWEFMR